MSERTSERCERMSERTSEWLSSYIWVLDGFCPQWIGMKEEKKGIGGWKGEKEQFVGGLEGGKDGSHKKAGRW